MINSIKVLFGVATAIIILIISCEKKQEIVLPTISTMPVQNITYQQAETGGNLIDNGGSQIISRGIVWNVNPNPTLEDNTGFTSQGSGIGAFNSVMRNLNPTTRYYVRAYASNNVGANYGESIEFITSEKVVLPVVKSVTLSIITTNSAIIEGNIEHDGFSAITEKGICWSENDLPDITDGVLIAEGNEIGSFSVSLAGLSPGKKYHVRAFAQNLIGIAFGEQSSFSTLASTPLVQTLSVSDVRAYSAICTGNIYCDGGSEIIQKGICWGLDENPDILNNNIVISDSGNPLFNCTLKNLDVHQKYYVRAFATNSAGTSYGEQKSFTTSPAIGDNYMGGYIFYLNSAGGGLVCATEDQSITASWGCNNWYMGYTNITLNSGMANTVAIIENCTEMNIAAVIANDLELNGFDDWFLPSKQELNLMYQNLKAQGLGNFANTNYWSSSEYNGSRAWAQGFYQGVQVKANKNAGYTVRAVRSF